ncbi:hypothetical protein VYU27_000488 [Nannochloropsis oceanica]
MAPAFSFAIDRGGTFTDVFCVLPEGKGHRVLKLLSEDPANYPDAPREGIRRILEKETGVPHPRDQPLDTSRIASIKMGTTVATNALLERKGERFALAITSGFRDLLHIGNQSRPNIFDLKVRKPEVLYETVVEIEERVVLVPESQPSHPDDLLGVTGERIRIEKAVDEAMARKQLQALYDAGFTSVAVVLLHAYTFTAHEVLLGRLAKEIGFRQVSLSSQVMPMVKMVPRGLTTCIDAYLTPVIDAYLQSFKSGFDRGLEGNVKVAFMQSDGGLAPMNAFSGHRAILSGPAGGVVGYAATVFQKDGEGEGGREGQPSIGFDMGGTSTDVSRYDGSFQHVFETTTAGITIQSPQLDISTVAAGGGSRLNFRNGLFVVGPESAGAHPGPVCYRKGGVLALTDANLLLGRVIPKYFPHIFGPREDEPLDAVAVRIAFEALTEEVNAFSAAEAAASATGGAELQYKKKTVDEVAYGFVRVANEAMCRPIRNLTTMRGFDITTHALACFGGAGPQHCCAMAKALGMRRIVVSRFSGVLSAYGIHLADIVVEKQEPAAGLYCPQSRSVLEARLDALEEAAREELQAQGFEPEAVQVERYLNLRFAGTDCALMTTAACGSSGGDDGDYGAAFEANYQREFGFKLTGRDIMVDDVRIRATGHSQSGARQKIAAAAAGEQPIATDYEAVYFEGLGRVQTPLYRAEELKAGFVIPGPAIIMQTISTVVVDPGCAAHVTLEGDFEIVVGEAETKRITTELDPIYLSIFAHRFMGIAEQMGRTLQRTSISVNIKERLDFSCAIFDESGGLVANAPHLPVHLGAMQEAVKYQLKHWGEKGLKEGDVLVSNHPQLAGGSHLPDITVITPVFNEGRIVFFVASRGHHADVGGIAPGSMPSLSKRLEEEGAAIVAFKLVEGGVFQEKGITELLQAPAQVPGSSGTRNLQDNLSDLHAQVAANTQGASLMHSLVAEYGIEVVQAYMQHIQTNAERAVRVMLTAFSTRQQLPLIGTVKAEDFMDDGTPICLAITIDRTQGSAVFDFAGTGPELYGNLNAPPAVTASAVIYCLRCLLPDVDIPLNQGCLVPVEIRIPPSSLLNPSPTAAVVGGNVLTSQRITDVIFRAFGAVAASQGCMNNLTFGYASMGYYETIAGGAGAGPTWHGESGVHTHMTNTRITDPEILERRFPVLLRAFVLRNGSGGRGKHCGGDGVIRELEFRRPLVVSILSERRAFRPYGLEGGEAGARGLNLLTFAKSGINGEGGGRGSRLVNLGGKNTVQVHAGDVLTIYTPGGGGFGVGSGGEEEEGGGERRPVKRRGVVHHLGNKGGGSLGQYKIAQESA